MTAAEKQKIGLLGRFQELVKASEGEINKVLLCGAVREIHPKKLSVMNLSETCYDAVVEERGGTRSNLQPLLNRIQGERRRDKDCVIKAIRDKISAKKITTFYHTGVTDPTRYCRKYQEGRKKDSTGNWIFGTQITIDGITIFIPAVKTDLNATTSISSSSIMSMKQEIGYFDNTLLQQGYIAVSNYAKRLLPKLQHSDVIQSSQAIAADAARIQVDHAQEILDLNHYIKSEYRMLSGPRTARLTNIRTGSRVRNSFGKVDFESTNRSSKDSVIVFSRQKESVQLGESLFTSGPPSMGVSFLLAPSNASVPKKSNDQQQLLELQKYYSTPIVFDEPPSCSVVSNHDGYDQVTDNETTDRNIILIKERQSRIALTVTKRRYEYIRRMT